MYADQLKPNRRSALLSKAAMRTIGMSLFLALVSACGRPATPAASDATPTMAGPPLPTTIVNQATAAVPTIAASPAPTTATNPATAAPILYFEYTHFDLEAYPPYPSQAVPLEYRERYWLSQQDARLMRFERMYRTELEPQREGLESFTVLTGSGGMRKECIFREGQPTNCSENQITKDQTFEEWLHGFTTGTREMVEAVEKSEELKGKYIYVGKEQDPLWGEVYVFQRPSKLATSERFPNQAITETLKIDAALRREVERTKISIIDGKETIHLKRKLAAWKTLDPADIPPKVFDPAGPLEQ